MHKVCYTYTDHLSTFLLKLSFRGPTTAEKNQCKCTTGAESSDKLTRDFTVIL